MAKLRSWRWEHILDSLGIKQDTVLEQFCLLLRVTDTVPHSKGWNRTGCSLWKGLARITPCPDHFRADQKLKVVVKGPVPMPPAR